MIARVLALPWQRTRRFLIVQVGSLLDGHGSPAFQVFEEDYSAGTCKPVSGMGDNGPTTLAGARERRMKWEQAQPERRDASGRSLGDDWLLASCGDGDDNMSYYVTTDRIHASEVGALDLGPRETAELLALAIEATRQPHLRRGQADRAALIGAILDAVSARP